MKSLFFYKEVLKQNVKKLWLVIQMFFIWLILWVTNADMDLD